MSTVFVLVNLQTIAKNAVIRAFATYDEAEAHMNALLAADIDQATAKAASATSTIEKNVEHHRAHKGDRYNFSIEQIPFGPAPANEEGVVLQSTGTSWVR